MHADNDTPSSWMRKYAPLMAAGGTVLDLACGAGRNARWLAGQGWRVEAVDRDAAALAALRGVPGVSARQADLEAGPWPYSGVRFAGIVVCRYLHRPLLPLLAHGLAPGGVLIYETFMLGQERIGRPRNPDYLLRPGELLDVYGPMLRVVAYAEGVMEEPAPAVLQRICAVGPARGGPASAPP